MSQSCCSGVGDTANPSNYKASVTDTDTDTFYLKIPDQLADHDYDNKKTQDTIF